MFALGKLHVGGPTLPKGLVLFLEPGVELSPSEATPAVRFGRPWVW